MFFLFFTHVHYGLFTPIEDGTWPNKNVFLQQAKEMVMELIRDQGFREQRGEYGSRAGGGDSLDVSV